MEILKGHFLHPFWLSELTLPAACQVKFMEWILTGIAGILCCAFLKSCVKGAIFPSETIRISSSNPGFRKRDKTIKLGGFRRIKISTACKKNTKESAWFLAFHKAPALVPIHFPPLYVTRMMPTGTRLQGEGVLTGGNKCWVHLKTEDCRN